MPVYLAFMPSSADIDEIEIEGAAFAFDARTMLVQTAQSRSRLYHGLKRQLPDGAPLLVAPLSEAPKFKGMREGALKAARRLFDNP